MKKRLMVIVLMFLLVVPLLVVAADDDSTCGFWCKLKLFFPQRAVVGEAATLPQTINADGQTYTSTRTSFKLSNGIYDEYISGNNYVYRARSVSGGISEGTIFPRSVIQSQCSGNSALSCHINQNSDSFSRISNNYWDSYPSSAAAAAPQPAPAPAAGTTSPPSSAAATPGSTPPPAASLRVFVNTVNGKNIYTNGNGELTEEDNTPVSNRDIALPIVQDSGYVTAQLTARGFTPEMFTTLNKRGVVQTTDGTRYLLRNDGTLVIQTLDSQQTIVNGYDPKAKLHEPLVDTPPPDSSSAPAPFPPPLGVTPTSDDLSYHVAAGASITTVGSITDAQLIETDEGYPLGFISRSHPNKVFDREGKEIGTLKAGKVKFTTVISAPPPPPPSPPQEQQIARSLTCFSQGQSACPGGVNNKPMTHGEAFEAYRQEARTQQVSISTKMGVGGKATLDGVEHTKTKDGWQYKEGEETKTIPQADFETRIRDTNAEGVDSFSLPSRTISENNVNNLNVGDSITYKGETYQKSSDGSWVNSKSQVVTLTPVAKADGTYDTLTYKTAEDQKLETEIARSDDLHSKEITTEWQGNWLESVEMTPVGRVLSGKNPVSEILTDIWAGASALGAYQPLSNAFFGPDSRNWITEVDSRFFSGWTNLPTYAATRIGWGVPGTNINDCTADSLKRAEKPGQSAVFVTGPGGDKQFVGQITAERSEGKAPILCQLNGTGAEQQWICPRDLVCHEEDTLCYKSGDAEIPEEGYFYKIFWGVTAPQDRKQTPYVDEDGKAVKFNVALTDANKNPLVWLYNRPGAGPKSAIALENGAQDQDLKVQYSPQSANYILACILFDTKIIDAEGFEVPDICAKIKTSSRGKVEFEKSDKKATSETVQKGEVGYNDNW